MYDLIIKNGCVIDGTGTDGYICDIAIADGKIVKMASNIEDDRKECIDAKGLTVTPGFIDSHSHSDNAMLLYPDVIEKIEQGITTSVAGQCGSTCAPMARAENPDADSYVANYGKASDVYRTFGTMADIAGKIPMGSNIMSFVGHGALRKTVMGFENRKPTTDEMNQMKELLTDAMLNGALGLSYGLTYTPGCYADTQELIELAEVVKKHGGMISAHIRNENFDVVDATKEFLAVIKAVNIRAVFSHHKAMHKPNYGLVNHTLKLIDDAVKEGYDIYCDVYPYLASSTGLVATIIEKELRSMDNEGIAKLVSDHDMRCRIKDTYTRKFGESLSNILVTICRAHPEYEGLRIDEIAKIRGQEQFDCAFDLIRDCVGVVKICHFSMCEEDLETVIKYERSMICTDSSVAMDNKVFHPRLKAAFPRAIGRYVRERKVVSLEEMIRKCTSLPASVYGLHTKGILCEGYDADICIFDADRIIDKSDFTNCNQRCEGLSYVILGGETVVENAIYNGKKKGCFILRQS